MKSAWVVCVVVSMLPSIAPAYAAEPRTEGIETAVSAAPADRRVRSREDMEAAQTDGLGYTRGKRNRGDDWFEPMRIFERNETARASAASAVSSGASTEPAALDDGPAPRTSGGAVTGDGQMTGSVQSAHGGRGRQGMVNAAGNSGSGNRGGDDSGRGKGIVNASGTSANASRGGDSGRGQGIVNAWGGSSVYSGRGGDDPPRGRGIVNAAGGAFGHQGASGGGGAGKGSAPVRPAGAGIVTGAGTAAAVSATTNASRGIVSAAGGQPGHGHGHGRGGGKR